MKKADLNLNDIISIYKETQNLHKTAKILKTSHLRISEILKENNIKINNVGKAHLVSEDEVLSLISDYVDNHLTMFELSKKYKIRLKKIRNIFKERNIVTSRWNGHVKQEKLTKKRNKRSQKKCVYCDMLFRDNCGPNNGYSKHLNECHGITENNVVDHIEAFPEDKKYLSTLIKNHNKVKCCICGKYLNILDNRHLLLHNINKAEYVNLYSTKILSDVTKEKLKLNYNKMMSNQTWDRKSSMYEEEIKKYLDRLGVAYSSHNRDILDGKEIDILTNNNVGIEFNGSLFHTEWFGGKDKYYHLNKLNKSNEKGVKLIQIFEDEFVYHKDIVFNKISHILHLDNNKPKIFARKCTIKEISAEMAENFLTKYHIQGFVSSSIYLGCYYGLELIAVMSFKKTAQEWELTRYATNYDYLCIGCGGKLFKYFVNKYDPLIVKSFADRRWTIDLQNNLYIKLGFTEDKLLPPDYKYYYLHDNKPDRYHKFGFRKQKLNKKYGLPLTMTETEMVKELGYDRIWDCGLVKYIWKRSGDNS